MSDDEPRHLENRTEEFRRELIARLDVAPNDERPRLRAMIARLNAMLDEIAEGDSIPDRYK